CPPERAPACHCHRCAANRERDIDRSELELPWTGRSGQSELGPAPVQCAAVFESGVVDGGIPGCGYSGDDTGLQSPGRWIERRARSTPGEQRNMNTAQLLLA